MMRLLSGLIGLGTIALFLEGCSLSKVLGLEPPGGKPAIMRFVVVTEEGDFYKIQYSLQDKDLNFTAAEGKLDIYFEDYDSGKVLHKLTFKVRRRDFKKYITMMGTEIWAHVILIRKSDVPDWGNRWVRVRLVFTTEDGSQLEGKGLLL